MLCLGLMSGTSLDGVDAALLDTDGESVREVGPAATTPYSEGLRERLRGVLGGAGPVGEVERELTLFHADAARALLNVAGGATVDLVGFHGHTILHRPDQRRTWQIGDGALLAAHLGLPVVNDFRSADVAAGGQGAPLVPAYHRALAANLPRPLAVLNLGGVANVTWIGESGELLAFDTGPGCALIDDWVRRHTGRLADYDGTLAVSGLPDAAAVTAFLHHPYFSIVPPKSLDRDDFRTLASRLTEGMGVADGAATLTAFTVAGVAVAARHFPVPPARWLVTGGGRRNPALLASLMGTQAVPVDAVEAVGWDGDALEAQAFAYLAARSLSGLPLTWPGTTGAPRPLTGGRTHRPG